MPSTDVLALTHRLSAQFLDSLADRHVGGRSSREGLLASLGGPLPITGADRGVVLDQLAKRADPGVVAQAGPRYFGFRHRWRVARDGRR